ncbi:MAG TPA: polysaccharide deacetylase family protein [Stellaceae bacterium]|nr:polysaccharide deacetylase family protein [Stellaceae bacterium]
MKRDLRRVSLPARLVREIGGFLCTRPAKIAWPGGVVSFTFDDFPRSAWANGGAILENYACRGTFYAAMGLAGTANHLGAMFAPGDLREAHAHGHEIACHTFTHRDCGRVPAGAIAEEIDRNAAALSAMLDGAPIDNFAYPFGGVSQAAKAAFAKRFVSCRGTGRGLNRGTVDLADLFGTSLYSRDFDRDRLCRLIEDAQAENAWLVFYTHDVADAPSPFGCTPAQFQSIVAYAAENVPVLPVRDVLARLGLLRAAARPEARAA